MPNIGDVVDGKYRLERLLGAGGMGVVMAARHLALDERVALKFLNPRAAADEATVARFLREGRAAVKIRGEHVARMMDVGMLDDGSPYLVMEYLEGRDVGAVLRDEKRLNPHLAQTVILQTCEALAEAHALGIVHRDLKPSNLFLTKRPDESTCVKVLDFGISKVTSFDADPTTSASILGTPHYMAPEQLRAPSSVDARADIWALGVILHQLLSGELPFAGGAAPEIFAAVLTARPRRLRVDLPSASTKLEAIILRCLEKDAARRFDSVRELARALAGAGAPDGRTASARIDRIVNAHAARAVSVNRTPPPSVAAVLEPGQTLAVTSPVGGALDGATGRLQRRRVVAAASGLGLVVALGIVLGVRAPSSSAAPQRAEVSLAPPAPESLADVARAAPESLARALPTATPAATARAERDGRGSGASTGGPGASRRSSGRRAPPTPRAAGNAGGTSSSSGASTPRAPARTFDEERE